jgi:Tfp pilus assembly protein FimT
MVVTAILAVISSIAAPSMLEIIRNNRLQSTNADFSALIKFARSEAKGKGEAVSLGTVDGATDWGDNTVRVFIDLNADGIRDNDEEELRIQDISDDFVITAINNDNNNISSVTFLGSGFTTNAQAFSFTLCDQRPSQLAYQYDILPSGLSFTGEFTCPP